MTEGLARKKRIRGGHWASTRCVTTISEALEARDDELNLAELTKF